MSAKAPGARARLLLSLAAVVAVLVFPPALPAAHASTPDIDLCDLPGCSLLEKALQKEIDIGKGMIKPYKDLGGVVAKTYDLATDPLGYFSEKFAMTNGRLIQELGGGIQK